MMWMLRYRTVLLAQTGICSKIHPIPLCVISPFLYHLFTHDCLATHDSNTIIKFADDTTVVRLITDNNETAYREAWQCDVRTPTSPST
jgi:hypothetical protein